jgi:hypothetical protein
MKTYHARAPYIVFTINTGAQKKEYILKQGSTVELPEDEHVVRAMVARHLIEPVSDEQVPAAPDSKTSAEKKKPKQKNS